MSITTGRASALNFPNIRLITHQIENWPSWARQRVGRQFGVHNSRGTCQRWEGEDPSSCKKVADLEKCQEFQHSLIFIQSTLELFLVEWQEILHWWAFGIFNPIFGWVEQDQIFWVKVKVLLLVQITSEFLDITRTKVQTDISCLSVLQWKPKTKMVVSNQNNGNTKWYHDQTVRGRVINRSLGFKRIEMEGHEDSEGCIRLNLSGFHGWLFARHHSHFWCRKSLSSASAWFASDCSHGGPHCTTELSLDE